MSAIYQRARPIRWEDVVGQEHVKDVLRAALEQGRVGHAYLFSGPRGVGKTTTARLIAMTANCQSGGPKPCGECESCLAVRAGAHPDVMEIDAASNNSVDDVRDLREKVGLAAMRGGKKIYILDEAHMMSRAAFNALLKTLEEPPGHVIFILATTEPEKIIPTILSRCQHYRFRRLTPEEIAGKLAGLAQTEGLRADPDALALIGRLADGAMRDGESLLERMLAAGTAVTRAAVEEALGLPPGERVRAVASALVLGDAGTALQGAAQLYRDGFAARTVVEGLVGAFGMALHAELGIGGADQAGEARLEGADVPRLLKLQAALDEQVSRFARSADGLSLELALTHALLATEGPATAASAPASAAGLPADLAARLNRLEKELATLRETPRAAAQAQAAAPVAAPRRESPAARALPEAEVAQVAAPAALQGHWDDVVRQASMQLRAFLKPARRHAEPGYVSLSYDEKNVFHAKQVATKFDEVLRLVRAVFGPVTFELIAPEGLGRRQGAGGGPGGGAGSAPVPRPAPPEPPRTPPVRAAQPQTAAEIPDFDPVPRRSSRGPSFEPLETAPAVTPASTGPVSGAPGTPPPRPATRPASVATMDPPRAAAPAQTPPPRPAGVQGRVPPPSPDDVAPAPLPRPAPAPWEEEHVADGPPAPADAQGGDRMPPADAARERELYLAEPITEEPDWGDLGGPVAYDEGGSGVPDLSGAPFAELSAPRPAPRPAPQPAAQPQTVAQTAAPARPGDIRAHPMYEDIKGRFSGRVREIGKNRRVQAEVAEPAGGDEDTAEA
ncbi:DNA polymerase III subunit gamma/tau [Deinococcus gobiensis]|uniref:DNA polymerase III subunit gamma/tau n=1 Tax=Deinococcus gobiensis (strain DSM 21396 / JCM 16679 / CGMCC 1.7299 / I-0) TaxID=745776 RepID=H8GV79_DEIGI|nr:DNA polymerase III subunit gamma/tau [Deinococcus gobiensis]AFD26754.1 DNA polymerase III, tau/gamma subunit [Deinococcus gobiensis I-0]